MNKHIREQLEQWARWRHYRHGTGYGKNLLQRCRDGMPGTNCPTCAGAGIVPGSLYGITALKVACQTCSGHGRGKLDANDHRIQKKKCPYCERGEVDGHTCFRCRGSGVLIRETDKANPATIPSTYREADNPVYQRIDRLVCELRQRDELLGYWFAIHMEYCDTRGGTQEIKATRLGITAGNYRKRLQRAIEWVDAGLMDRQDVRDLEFVSGSLNTRIWT